MGHKGGYAALGLVVLVVHKLALPLEGRVPVALHERVRHRRVRRRQGQRVLQLRRRPQDAQRVRGQLLPASRMVLWAHMACSTARGTGDKREKIKCKSLAA